jgi:hypothetical protein
MCLKCRSHLTSLRILYGDTTDYRKLQILHYAPLQWHNDPTNNREYQWSGSRLDVYAFTTNSVTTRHVCRQIYNFLDRKWHII